MARDLSLGIDGDSKGAVTSLNTAAAAVDKLKRKADDLGDEFRQASRDAAGLERELAKLAVESKLLAKEFSNSDTAGRSVIKEKIDLNRSAANELKKIRAEVVGDTEKDAKKAVATWKKASADFDKIASAGSRIGIDSFGAAPALGVVGAAAAPLVGAAAGGALLAAGGLAVAGAGIVGAAQQSKEVQNSWFDVIDHVQQRWMASSKTFIGPLIDASHEFDKAFSAVDIEGTLAKASTLVKPFAAGVAGFLKELGPGIDRLVEGAGPAVDKLSDSLPRLGAAFSDAFDAIADGAEGGAKGLEDLTTVSGYFVIGTGHVVGGLEELYGWLAKQRDTLPVVGGFWKSFFHDFDSSIQPLHGTAESFLQLSAAERDASAEFAAMISSIGQLPATAEQVAGAITDKLINTMLSLDQANLGVAEAVTRVGDSFEKNGRQLDIHTKAGQANRESVLASVAANLRQYDTLIASGVSATDAAAAYDVNTESLRKQLEKAGLTKGKIDELIGSYAKVPDKVNTDIAARGLTNTLADLRETLVMVHNLNGQKIVINSYLHEHYTKTYDDMGLGHQGQAGRASGGPIAAGTPYLVGEKGPEIIVPSMSGTVIDAAASANIMTRGTGSALADTGWGRGAPAMPGPSTLGIVFGGNTDSAYATAFASLIRNNAIMLNVDGVPVKVS